jgi:L-alanine-DL-glutamate epimerase-like enolase superfamily enzyme
VIVVKPARVGGSAATMRIVEAAVGRGASAVLGTFYETGVGIAAVLRIAAAMQADAPSSGRRRSRRPTAWRRPAC